ncbi:hypothetical protein FV297_26470 [Escherichia coli]|nr:hypothetical protein A1YI_00379 [Escherichia coli KTE132]EOW53860.1 hypothetical protein A1YG_00343 [Escherichia coli KTE130]TXQ39778.1 hypothetical protein FV297_26470 [Escherichia coli]
MFIVESYAVAIIMCFITMICWGSWANTTKLVSNKNGSSLYSIGKRKLTAVCSHQTRIGNLDAHLI